MNSRMLTDQDIDDVSRAVCKRLADSMLPVMDVKRLLWPIAKGWTDGRTLSPRKEIGDDICKAHGLLSKFLSAYGIEQE